MRFWKKGIKKTLKKWWFEKKISKRQCKIDTHVQKYYDFSRFFETVFKNTMIFHGFLKGLPQEILLFSRRGDLPKQSGPPRRSLPGRCGGLRRVSARSRIERRGSPQTHIYTRAYQRLAVVGPPNSLKLMIIKIMKKNTKW